MTKKKATNVSIDGDLLAKAKALDINLSATLEHALANQVREQEALYWLNENREAIEAYNRAVEKEGVFSDGSRGF